MIWPKEGNVLFNDALNTFYLWLYGIIHIVKDYSGNLLPPLHGLLFPINSKGSLYDPTRWQDSTTTVFGIPVVEHWLEQKVFQTVILNDTHTFLWMVYQFWMNQKDVLYCSLVGIDLTVLLGLGYTAAMRITKIPPRPEAVSPSHKGLIHLIWCLRYIVMLILLLNQFAFEITVQQVISRGRCSVNHPKCLHPSSLICYNKWHWKEIVLWNSYFKMIADWICKNFFLSVIYILKVFYLLSNIRRTSFKGLILAPGNNQQNSISIWPNNVTVSCNWFF